MPSATTEHQPSPDASRGREPVVRFRGVTVTYGAVRALDDLSFSATAARVTGFLGPNGAGKSTALRALLGLVRPTRGLVELGQDGRRPTVGAVLDPGHVHPKRTGRNHLRTIAPVVGADDGRVDEVLTLVGLQDAADRRVGGWSLGMRQRLGLGAALLGRPELLVLDEPANGLDPAGMRWLRTTLQEQAAQGVAVLVSSHALAEVAEVADDLVVIDAGRLVSQSTTRELLAAHPGRSLEDIFLDLTTKAPR